MGYLNPKSTTFWSGIASIAGGIALLLNGGTEAGLAGIVAGIAMIGGRKVAEDIKSETQAQRQTLADMMKKLQDAQAESETKK